MTEVRLVGRGGQGIVTAGDVAGRAAVDDGRWAQSMPTFGPERRGALTQSTLRIADEPIRLKCTASNPSVVLVIDPTIWRHVDVTRGLDADAIVMVYRPVHYQPTHTPPDEVELIIRANRHGPGGDVVRASWTPGRGFLREPGSTP